MSAKINDRINRARDLWSQATSIPTTSHHPARRWLERNKLWRSKYVAPNVVRWLPPKSYERFAGHIVSIAAPPTEWENAWPQIPEPNGVNTIPITHDGLTTTDNGGLRSRSHGLAVKGNVLLIGRPHESGENDGLAHIVSGATNALFVAARYPGAVWTSFGDIRYMPDSLIRFLPGCAAVWTHKNEQGQVIFNHLREKLASHNVIAYDVNIPSDESIQATEWNAIDSNTARKRYAELRIERPDEPHWELVRLAGFVGEEHARGE